MPGMAIADKKCSHLEKWPPPLPIPAHANPKGAARPAAAPRESVAGPMRRPRRINGFRGGRCRKQWRCEVGSEGREVELGDGNWKAGPNASGKGTAARPPACALRGRGQLPQRLRSKAEPISLRDRETYTTWGIATGTRGCRGHGKDGLRLTGAVRATLIPVLLCYP
eukprot:gene13970-biopygen11697